MYKEQNEKKSKILRRKRILEIDILNIKRKKLFLKLIDNTNTHKNYCKNNSLGHFTYIEFKCRLTSTMKNNMMKRFII
jgi:hypothetical protein